MEKPYRFVCHADELYFELAKSKKINDIAICEDEGIRQKYFTRKHNDVFRFEIILPDNSILVIDWGLSRACIMYPKMCLFRGFILGDINPTYNTHAR